MQQSSYPSEFAITLDGDLGNYPILGYLEGEAQVILGLQENNLDEGI